MQDLAHTEIAEENKAKIHCTVPKWARGTWGGVGTNVADMFDIVSTLRRAPLHGWSLSSNPQISRAVCLQTLLQPLRLRHSRINNECTCAFKNVHCKKLVLQLEIIQESPLLQPRTHMQSCLQ